MDIININYFTSGRAACPGLPPGAAVPMIYSVGRKSRLYRLSSARPPFGAYMALSISGCSGGTPAAGLASAILAECAERRFSAVIVFGPPSPVHASLVRALAPAADKLGVRVLASEELAEKCGCAGVLLGTSVTSGRLSDKLRAAVGRYGSGGVALELCRMRASCLLPASGRAARELTPEELRGLLSGLRPRVNYSDELCVRYFNYRDGAGTHFVLFDDSFSLGKKLDLGRAFGLSDAFFYYSEVRDIIGELERHRSRGGGR